MDRKVRIGVLGSCSTRNVFTTQYNDYKQHFELIFSYERISLISIFQNPVKFKKEDIVILPDDATNRFRTRNIEKDFKKSFLSDLKKGIDVLILDFYFEALFGILMFDDNIITNNIWDLPSTDFYKNLENTKICTMYENPEKYFKLWVNACDKLFIHLNNYYPDVKIILNRICLVDKVLRDDYSFYLNTDFRWMINTYGPLIKMMEDYIIENFQVEVIESNVENFSSENNRWRPYVVHHTDDYYKYLYWDICKLVGVDEFHVQSSKLAYIDNRLNLCEKIISNNDFVFEEINPKMKYDYPLNISDSKIKNLMKKSNNLISNLKK